MGQSNLDQKHTMSEEIPLEAPKGPTPQLLGNKNTNLEHLMWILCERPKWVFKQHLLDFLLVL